MKRRGFLGTCAAIAMAPLSKLLPEGTGIGTRTVTWVSPGAEPVYTHVRPDNAPIGCFDIIISYCPDAYAILTETTPDVTVQIAIRLPVSTRKDRIASEAVKHNIEAWASGGPWTAVLS